MQIWSNEIKELEQLYSTLKGLFPDLEKELEQLILTEDANVVMLYSRRCLEVIITDLCECELKRPRKTEPLKGIIDKLNKEGKIPSHIYTSMDHLNSLSSYGAHPKEFDPRQVKPVLNNLLTVIEWYLDYKKVDYQEEFAETEIETDVEIETESDSITESEKVSPDDSIESDYVAKRKRKTLVISSWIIGFLIIILIAFGISSIFQKLKFRDIKAADGRISVTVLPFQNLTPDTLMNFWQEGVQNLLISSLSSSKELSIRPFQTMFEILSNKKYKNYASITPSIGRDIASKLEATTFITGNLMKAGDMIRISAQLRNTKTEEIFMTFDVEVKTENDFFKMTDSLSLLIKDFLEIKALEKDLSYDAQAFSSTNSPEAYRYYIDGIKFGYNSNVEFCIQSLEKAIEYDSSFTGAFYFLSLASWMSGNHSKAKYYIERAYASKNDMPLNEKISFEVNQALIDKNCQKVLDLEKQLCILMPQVGWWKCAVGNEYYFLEQYNKSVESFEIAWEFYNKIDLNFPPAPFYNNFVGALHEAGNHEREKEIVMEGLKIYPDYYYFIYQQAVCAFSQGDTTHGNEYLDQLRAIRSEQDWEESGIINEQAGIYEEAVNMDKAAELYRKALKLDQGNSLTLHSYAHFLIKNNIDVKNGMELIDRALKSEPDNGDWLYTKGLGLYKQGRLEEASELLKKAWDLRLWYSHEHYLLIQEVEKELSNKGK